MTSSSDYLALMNYKSKLSSSMIAELGNVRHPRRIIKIYKYFYYRELNVIKKDNKQTYTDGNGTVYMETIESVQNLSDESARKKRFQDKWIHFAFLKDKEQQWYIYDPNSEKLKGKEDEQVNQFGMFGFSKVDKKYVDRNEKTKNLAKGQKGWSLEVLDEDLLNCTFGYNYDQAAMQISVMLSNDKGKNRGKYHSGDIVKVYMWYDKPDRPDFTRKVEDWVKNTNIDDEDSKLFHIRQKHYDKGIQDDEKASNV